MSGRKAIRLLIIISLIIAFLMFMNIVNHIAAAVLFASALVVLGIISKGFKKKDKAERI